MNPAEAEAATEANAIVKDFTSKLEKKLCESPEKIIRRKNPFLFRVRAVSNVQTLADMVINAYLSSSEETMFWRTWLSPSARMRRMAASQASPILI